MALRITTDFPCNGMTFDRVVATGADDPADRVSVKAVLGALNATPDYLPQEKPYCDSGLNDPKFRAKPGKAN